MRFSFCKVGELESRRPGGGLGWGIGVVVFLNVNDGKHVGEME